MVISKEALESAEKYWIEKFADGIEEMKLDYHVTTKGIHEKKSILLNLDKSNSEELIRIAKGQDLLLYIITLTLMKIVLYKYTGQRAITLGAPIYSTSGEKYDYNQCIAFKDDVSGEMTFKELLIKVRKTVVDGYENQFYSMERLVDLLANKVYKQSLFQVVMMMENLCDIKNINEVIYSDQNDMTVSINEHGSQISATIIYDSYKFTSLEIETLWRSFNNVTRQVLSDKNIKICDIELVSEDEKLQLLNCFNHTACDYPKDKTVYQLFDEQARETPDQIAVEKENECITYKELMERASQWASVLRENGVKADSAIGIIMDYSIELVVGILAILKAGGAYVPIDVKYPMSRINYILEDSKVNIVLTDESSSKLLRLNEIKNSKLKIVVLKNTPDDMFCKDDLEMNWKPNDLAYVIYTSGSTGKPKGVMVEHRNIVNQSNWRIKQYEYSSKDKILQLVSISFDAFGANFYSALLSGATLVFPIPEKMMNPEYINRLITDKSVTSMSVVPSMYGAIIQQSDARMMKSLRYVILGGETAGASIVKLSKKTLPWVSLVNEYGPTENTITSTYKVGMDLDNLNIIGKPINNTKIYIIDRDDKLQPIGVAGQLCVAGHGVARGYLNNNKLTENNFVKSPFEENERMYKTGDMARWTNDGEIEYLGRLDSQVKINGFRIELGEIERVIEEFDFIKGVVVVDREDAQHFKYICAYIVTSAQGAVEQLRGALKSKLPGYLIPSQFVILETLPLSPNGKVDRLALPDPEQYNKTRGEVLNPGNVIERNIAKIWGQVLNRQDISITDSFFDIGGNSILLMNVYSQIDKLYPGKVTIPILFNYPTIQKLAEYLESEGEATSEDMNKMITFPNDYLTSDYHVNEYACCKFDIADELFQRIQQISDDENIDKHDILLSAFICLFTRVAKQKDITVYTNLNGVDDMGAISVNMDELADVKDLIHIISERKKRYIEKGHTFNQLSNIKFSSDKSQIRPLYCSQSMNFSEIKSFKIYDIILEAEKENDKILMRCEYNSGKLKETKMEEFLNTYIKLLRFLVKQY